MSSKGLPRGVRKLFLEVRQGAEVRPQLDGATGGVAYGFGEAIGGRRDGRSAPPALQRDPRVGTAEGALGGAAEG